MIIKLPGIDTTFSLSGNSIFTSFDLITKSSSNGETFFVFIALSLLVLFKFVGFFDRLTNEGAFLDIKK